MLTKINSMDWKFYRKAMRVLLPMIASALLLAFVGFIDNIIASGSTVHDLPSKGIEKIDYKAVGVGNEIFFLLAAVIGGVGVLFSILFAQFSKHINRFVDTAKWNIIVSFIVALGVSILMYFIAETSIGWFFGNSSAADKEYVQKHGTNFVKILSIGHFFYAMTLNLLNPLTIKGKVCYSIYLAVVSLIVNATFDMIFIYVVKWGAEGCAWSTNIAYIVQFVLVIILSVKNKKFFKGIFDRFFKLNFGIFKEFAKRLPMGLIFMLMQSAFAVSTILWTSLYDSDLIAPLTTTYIVANLMFSTLPAIAKSVAIFIGPLLGSGKNEEAKLVAKKLWWANLFVGLIMASIAMIASTFFPAWMLQGQNGESKGAFLSQQLIWVFAASLPGYYGVNYFSALFETGGLQVIPNVWNRGFTVWAQVPMIVLCSSVVIGLDPVPAFAINNLICYIAFAIVYAMSRRNKWVRKIEPKDDYI